MRSIQSFNTDWQFHADPTDAVKSAFVEGEPIVLPHNALELPFNYFDEKTYQKPYAYQKLIHPDPAWADKEVTLRFDAAMADAKVYLNGHEIAAHKDGYTPFEARLTGLLKDGGNLLTVTIDGSENPQIPPFGAMIDYLTYAGIYRDAWLRVTPPLFIANQKIETPNVLEGRRSVRIAVALANPQGKALSGTIRATLRDGDTVLATTSSPVTGPDIALAFDGLENIELWDIDAPKLYAMELVLETPHGTDATETKFGFRSAQFTPDGFLLNGQPLKIRGLNRHQSFPHAGYGLGRAAQERDADILKHELKLNTVRTSHYPQSSWFLDRCDEIGLLVFEEIPGWQHIGGTEWKAESVKNVRRMIERDWNHPSIIIWGVRINESQDDHDFYAETNRVAHELDTTRQTGGVRYITESEMLEDVYTMNDFILGNEELGGNRPRTPLRPVAETTGLDRPVPYLVTEYNGHMYPTKSYDQEQRQAEHVIRHLEVLNATYGDPAVSGCIGWCAFDYNTHADFGSGDRICHHGVMDMYREPKFAAYAYASQAEPDNDPVLAPVTFWARGERNIGGVLPLIVLTNCDEVEFTYGDNPPKRIKPDVERFPHLPHPPVIIDRRHFSADELGRWGMVWEDAKIVGYVDGKPMKTTRFVANPALTTLQVAPDREMLAAQGKDSVRVMVRALDQAGNKMPFLFEPVSISVEGPAVVHGPKLVSLRGGATGFWLESTGTTGPVSVTVTSERLGTTTVQLKAE
ncbi:glycoside hydrolase family 2 TIM barrel-domain containing protein [Devosia rhodophyticola]|uniref:Glycoside hydrolase family 2 TIM barrel-domain containing protein n=1 Tax=Devosia rhodophyticola TaxID=3026423 RepID=A0ABY7YW97_9HYPH|nr:glycoside hydrolase family 2 TIM barrel-domain containing protein [Devosia rhodophyticola]WDR05643.1 glycoside hydrolase family 2 TIM barrel-domain containing protein [Devosia rhodophyticola]